MAYTKVGWTDNVTPLNAENLNHMDNGISFAQDTADKANSTADSAKSVAENAEMYAANANKIEFINSITITKASQSITINQDIHNLSFTLNKFILMIISPEILIPASDTFKVYVPDASSPDNCIYKPGNVIYNTKKMIVQSEIIGDRDMSVFNTWCSCVGFGNAPSGTTQHGDFISGKPITSITVSYSSNAGFVAGTEFKLYGHRT